MLLNPTPSSRADPGASSRPHETAAAICHGDTMSPVDPVDPAHRRATAAPAATTAATASATGQPAGSGSKGSGSNWHNNLVKASRNGPARSANRRNQPRTVAAGRPNRSATLRCPHPCAAHPSAAPITSTASARRANTLTGNNTCVTRQPAQRARRGRSRQPESRSPRTTRARPNPHGRNRPRQAGHTNPPSASRRSTSLRSLPTVSTGASEHHAAALPGNSAKRTPGGPFQIDYPNPLTMSSHTTNSNPARPPTRTITPNDATQPLPVHQERRPTGRPDVPRPTPTGPSPAGPGPDDPSRADSRWISRRLPPYIYQQLRHGFVRSVAGDLVDSLTPPGPPTGPAPPRPAAHPGEPFGVVIAWLWASDRHEVPELLADLLTELRHHGSHAGKLHPPITLDELLDGLRLALPSSFTAHEYDQLAQLARTEVPRYLLSDPNNPDT